MKNKKRKNQSHETTTFSEQVQRWVREYRNEGNPWPTDRRTIASWMIRTGRASSPRKTAIDWLAPLVSKAMREDFFTDPQGRRPRRMHAVPQSRELPDGTFKQSVLWVDIVDATPPQMRIAFQTRRKQILGDNRQLKTDVDSFNDNNKSGAHIQMSFDYTEDLIELENPTDYDGIDGEE